MFDDGAPMFDPEYPNRYKSFPGEKLSPEVIDEINRLYESGTASKQQIKRDYGLGYRTLHIVLGIIEGTDPRYLIAKRKQTVDDIPPKTQRELLDLYQTGEYSNASMRRRYPDIHPDVIREIVNAPRNTGQPTTAGIPRYHDATGYPLDEVTVARILEAHRVLRVSVDDIAKVVPSPTGKRIPQAVVRLVIRDHR